MRIVTIVMLLVAVSPVVAAADDALTGAYVEARSCTVFAGGCHYNGEFGTEGRKATMAFSFERGRHDGVALAGVDAVAVVTADRNLDLKDARRKSVIYVDAAATDAQRRAVADAIRSHCAGVLGDVVATKVVPISFEHAKGRFLVQAGDAVALCVEEKRGRPCCNMPWRVLYKPLVKMSERRVGNTTETRVSEKALSAKWVRQGEVSSFHGQFTFADEPSRVASR